SGAIVFWQGAGSGMPNCPDSRRAKAFRATEVLENPVKSRIGAKPCAPLFAAPAPSWYAGPRWRFPDH
ncbi:hypothetical protein ACIPID_07435, partial [Cupriavidus sp. CER94]|uniref:hypothetical protein n=1 Tax=Cupriavidus sp. CER94 TaxID=3377036 RepID=UPI003803D9D9